MIHQLLHLTRPLFVLDCETTGTTKTSRIVEIGFQLWTPDGMQKEWRTLVNPECPIPPVTTKLHGITDEMVRNCRECGKQFKNDCVCPEFKPWPAFRHLASSLAKGFSNCDFAGKRVRFDLQVIGAEMVRTGQPWSYETARIVDADRLEAIGEPRSLSDLYEKHTGQKLDDAHKALVDVRGTTVVIEHQLRKYEPVLPRDLDALHTLQWPGWIDTEGLFRFVDDVPTVKFGKHRDWDMRTVPSSYWDFMLSKKASFSDEIKKIAAAAKLGQFPTVKL